MFRKPLFRGIAAILAAFIAAMFLMAHTAKQPLYAEVAVTTMVPAGQAIPSGSLGTVEVSTPPASGVATSVAQVAGKTALENLYPGQTVVSSEYGTSLGNPPKGYVAVFLPVGAAQSAMPAPGSRVDILMVGAASSTAPASSAPLATDVLVLNVYSGNGGAVQTTGTSAQAPGMVEVALTPAQALLVVPQLSQSSSYWLVLDPFHAL